MISLLAGVTFSPHALNIVRPLSYTTTQANLDIVTLAFSRLVLGVQLVLAGVQLPSRYLAKEWKSLLLLLGPIMTLMWLASSLIIWGLVPDLPFLHALAVGACVTPTDPVLSNGIVKGKFADKNIPKDLQKIIIAESGANDGLGYPFLFLALYLMKYNGGHDGGVGKAMSLWFGETWGYTIILSVVYGASVGWIAKELLRKSILTWDHSPYFTSFYSVYSTVILLTFHRYRRRKEIHRPGIIPRVCNNTLPLHSRNLRNDRQRRCSCMLHCWQRIYLGRLVSSRNSG